jgi:hypothetical protein
MNAGLIDFNLTSGDCAAVTDDYPAVLGFASTGATTSGNALFLSNQTANWVFEAAKRLDSLVRLQPGWDSHGGVALRADTKQLTLDVINWLKSERLPVPAVVLGSGGTIHLEWRKRGKELEVGIGERPGLDFIMVYPDGDIEEGQAKHQLPSRVRDLTSWLLED